MSDYALYEDPDTKEKSYKRFAPRGNDGVNFPDFNNFKFDGPESSSALKFAVSINVDIFVIVYIIFFNRPIYTLKSEFPSFFSEALFYFLRNYFNLVFLSYESCVVSNYKS